MATNGDTAEVDNTMKFLTEIDLELAESYEKLIKLHSFSINLLVWDSELEVYMLDITDPSEKLVEKALVHDLLSGILDSELREVENYVSNVEAEIADVHYKISSCRNSTELFAAMEEKLCDLQDSMKNSQQQFLDIKRHLTRLQRELLARSDNRIDENKKAMKLVASDQPVDMNLKTKWQMVDRQKHALKMLEKSLVRELHREKRLSKLRLHEEQLKLKLHCMEQVTFHMEEASEVVWGRFLEAENAAEVLMGASKELVGQQKVLHLKLIVSLNREAMWKSHLEECTQQSEAKDLTIEKLNSSIVEHVAKSSEVLTLKEKVKSLEEELRRSEFQLETSHTFIDESEERLAEMEHVVESLKESLDEAENRTETAEAKVTQLTDTNTELTDEISFLKENRENTTKKVSVLEKQLRDTEIKLQHAKASSEASQEQQNMLYSAIWDMETLIEDLKSKVAKADSKTERVEEQCITFSKTNAELNEELNFLRNKVRSLETSLKQDQISKDANAEEIELRTRLVSELVTQLSKERECIQNQAFLLVTENQMLVQRLLIAETGRSINSYDDKDGKAETAAGTENDSSNTVSGQTLEEAAAAILPNGYQNREEDNVAWDVASSETGTCDSLTGGDDSDRVSTSNEADAKTTADTGNPKFVSFVKAFVAVMIAVLIYILHKEPV